MKRKLELTWVGKEDRPRLEPRLLIEEEGMSHQGGPGITDNLLIQGDNLLALKALEAEYAGRIKCVFIDPPYNTGSAFEHYDDGLEHSIWLSMMRDRLEVIRRLLSDDGSLWVTLDDNEAHYFKVMADEVFGRANYVTSFAWNSRKSMQNDARFTLNHNWVICYAKDTSRLTTNRLPASAEKFSNADNDPRGPWTADPFDAPNIRPNLTYEIVNPNTGTAYWPPSGRCWRTTQDEYLRLLADNRIVFGKTGKSKPQAKRFFSEAAERGQVPGTWWEDTGTATEATKELHALLGRDQGFETPKPERLLERILTLATNPGDLVLDSFAGSGTTGAVAHKMGRRWIMIEIGDHAQTHIVPRLTKVIDGQDPGGVTAATNWKGGGGFRFCRLAPSLIRRDRWGREVISDAYDADLLAQALCKLEGFRFEPSESEWWIHGRSSEADHIHVTTQTLSHEQLAELSELVGEDRTLLVLCAAWRGDADAFPNLTVRKIPDHVLKRCDWGRDDYSLPGVHAPEAAE